MLFFTCSDGNVTVTSQRILMSPKPFHAWTDEALDGFDTELTFTLYHVHESGARIKILTCNCQPQQLSCPKVGYKVIELLENTCELTYSAEKYEEGGIQLFRLFIATLTLRCDVVAFLNSLHDKIKLHIEDEGYYVIVNEKYDPPMRSTRLKPRFNRSNTVAAYSIAPRQIMQRKRMTISMSTIKQSQVYYGVQFFKGVGDAITPRESSPP